MGHVQDRDSCSCKGCFGCAVQTSPGTVADGGVQASWEKVAGYSIVTAGGSWMHRISCHQNVESLANGSTGRHEDERCPTAAGNSLAEHRGEAPLRVRPRDVNKRTRGPLVETNDGVAANGGRRD
ncbi:unnamed protein product [Lampetra planeri]